MKKYWQPDWAKDGPTQGVASLVGYIRGERRHIVDAGQGAELPLPAGALSKLITGSTSIKLSGPYNTAPGGERPVRADVARYVRDFYRMPATEDNTFLYQGLGRAGVKILFERATGMHRNKSMANNHPPVLIMSDLHWPTLGDLAKDQGLQVIGYDHSHPKLSVAIADVLRKIDPRHVAIILLNYPLNPTSKGIDRDQMIAFMTVMDEFNARPDVSIMVMLDMPYAYASAPDEDIKGRFLQTGMEHVFDKPWATKVSGVISFSKFLSAAPVGASMLFAFDDDDARDIARRLSIGGLGITRNNKFLAQVAKAVGGKHDDWLWTRKDVLREKYMRNRSVVEKSFGNRVYPGLPNMLSLVSIPASEVFNRVVKCCDGDERILRSGSDVIEYLANNHEIAVVANGVKEGNFLIRIAQREEHEVFAPGIKSLVEGLRVIKESPVYNEVTAVHETGPLSELRHG